jgi:serine/threonine protein kinase
MCDLPNDEATMRIVRVQCVGESVRSIPIASLSVVRDEDGEPRLLEDGGQGSVCLYNWTTESGQTREVAVNKVHLKTKLMVARREATWQLACAASAHVCRLLGVCWLQNTALIVMEHHPTTLEEHVQQECPGGLPHAEVLHVSLELACALDALHSRAKSTHRNVQPLNVLLSQNLAVQLADFGFSNSIRAQALNTRIQSGRSGYAAPEELLEGSSSVKSDVYSLGLTIAFCALGRHPCQGMTKSEMQSMLTTALHLPVDNLVDVGLRKVVEQLTARDPAERPTMAVACTLLQTLDACC